MPSKNPAQRLRDILDNIHLLEGFTSGFAYAGFESDRKTAYAVVRALEIISEAVRRLPDELKERNPDVDTADARVRPIERGRGVSGLGCPSR